MKESKLFYINRIGLSAMALGTLALDAVNTVQSHILGLTPLNLGYATTHIGSAPGLRLLSLALWLEEFQLSCYLKIGVDA